MTTLTDLAKRLRAFGGRAGLCAEAAARLERIEKAWAEWQVNKATTRSPSDWELRRAIEGDS